jgi:hypothetical protein
MNPMPAFAVIAGQLLGTAFACGLNLYATIALMGLGTRLGWITTLPPGLRGLQNGLVIGSAITLFLIEFIVEKVKYAGAVWDAVHTIVRPLGAALLAVVALETMPWEVKLAGAVASATTAFAAHGVQAGLRVMIANSRFADRAGRAAIMLTTLFIDGLAVALVWTTLRRPETALGIVAGALVLSMLIGPRLWRAAGFGAESVVRRVRRFFGRQGWRTRDRLPRRIRAVVPPADLGRSPARGARAAAVGLRGAGTYRTGWLVVSDYGNAFVFRSFISARRIDLPPFTDGRVEVGPLCDTLHCSSDKRTYTLLLLKDGPSADQAMMALREYK